MKKLLFLGYLLICNLLVFAQTPSPTSFLGYELGSKFTPHHQVVAYFKAVSANHNNIQYINYGKTYEGRELVATIISSPENMARIEEIKKNNIALTAFSNNIGKLENQPAILWLSYNVHGNEASSTESAMKMLYALANPTEQIKNWLKNTIVIIDPCLNPDGRDRYVHYFNSTAGKIINPDPSAREHIEPWPGGRSNHYYFDLNRDWAWQSQIETQQRMKLYHEWMPQVHVDFHEQGYNDPYYFAPAAEPIHADITPWQRQFQEIVGRNNAKYFDRNGWQYFTKERFDLLYPAYGDTYPIYNGAIGMTYEQGGSGRAGLAVITAVGDTLTLKDRLEHHFTSGLATIETVSLQAGKLLAEFKSFFTKPQPRKYKSFLIKATHDERMLKLVELLDKNKIEYGFGLDRSVSGYSYQANKQENIKVNRNDLIIHLDQSKAMLANVLFEPFTFVSDSNTYDITAWALPYAYNLPAYALTESVKGKYSNYEFQEVLVNNADPAYAWLLPWKAISDSRVLIALQQAGLKVRIAGESFTINNKEFDEGTLLIYMSDNNRVLKAEPKIIETISKKFEKQFYPVLSGFVDKGKDLGSNVYRLLSQPKIAIASGTEVSSLSLGEVWHFLEEELSYPYTILNTTSLSNLDINKVNVLILPSGRYNDQLAERLLPWVQSGGKLILIEDSINAFMGKKPYEISRKEEIKSKNDVVVDLNFGAQNSDNHDNSLPGAIFKVHIDKFNPMNFGLGETYYALKTDDKLYNLLTEGYNTGVLRTGNHVSGVAGKNVINKLQEGMLFGYQSVGRGKVVFFGVNPLFRSFWESGKQMFINGLFSVN